ncbi:MAG: MFS transporter, partial [Candidatus Eremiobacteraeota bacterium]|nr:MFS transporter [Candidatus Eremiobacteraeota bacterium]
MTTRVVRAIAYGLFSVAFALFLSARGLPATLIGVVLTVALLSGAGLAWATGWLVRRYGQRGTLVGAAALMAVAALVLGAAHGLTIILLAALLGTLSAGGQEVGPFGPVEQQIIAESGDAHGAARRFAIYNLAGSFAAAVGALVAGVITLAAAPWVYAACGAVLLVVYALVIPNAAVARSSKTGPASPAPAAPQAPPKTSSG